MPDITMCTGEDCERKNACYRFTATPNEYRQSYFTISVYEIVDNKQICNYYTPNGEYKGYGYV